MVLHKMKAVKDLIQALDATSVFKQKNDEMVETKGRDIVGGF